MSLVTQVRPGPAFDIGVPEKGTLRRSRGTPTVDHTGQQRDADDLATTPGSPSYLSKIPNPPCATCSQDHNPMHEAQGKYNHPYRRPGVDEDAAEVMTVDPSGSIMPASLVPVSVPILPPVTGTGAPATQRVNVIPGRGEDVFIVGIETAPDWDLVDSWKMTADQLLPMLPVLRALNIKIRDNTAGELKALEMERNGS